MRAIDDRQLLPYQQKVPSLQAATGQCIKVSLCIKRQVSCPSDYAASDHTHHTCCKARRWPCLCHDDLEEKNYHRRHSLQRRVPGHQREVAVLGGISDEKKTRRYPVRSKAEGELNKWRGHGLHQSSCNLHGYVQRLQAKESKRRVQSIEARNWRELLGFFNRQRRKLHGTKCPKRTDRHHSRDHLKG